jgi:integration host factor subunit alpha
VAVSPGARFCCGGKALPGGAALVSCGHYFNGLDGRMGGKTLTRADLAEAVYRKVGLSRTESADLVEEVLNEICEAIVRGETVKLSSFATFQVRSKNERIGRNPKTGEEVPILPRRVMTFKASNVLKNRILRSHQNRSKGGK